MSKLIVEMEMPTRCPCVLAVDNNGWFSPCFAHHGIPSREKEFDDCIENGTRPDWCPIKGEISEIELMHLEEERAFAARNIAAESEADADYQLSVLMQEYFERYEPTYNSEDGSM